MLAIFRWHVLRCVEMVCNSLTVQKAESARTCKVVPMKLVTMKKTRASLYARSLAESRLLGRKAISWQ
jgi:hypothetical protein